MAETVAIITARGGSRRLPGKNVAPICGKPLVEWSIIQARCSRQVDRTVLTTDDDEIAAVGEKAGAEVIRRPVWHWDTTANVPYAHAIETLRQGGVDIGKMLLILPTSPLKWPWDFDHAIRVMAYTGADHVIPVSRQRETMVYRVIDKTTVEFVMGAKHFEYADQGGAFSLWDNPDTFLDESRALPDRDAEIDKYLLQGKSTHGRHRKRFTAYFMEPWQRYDIDDHRDLVICGMLLQHYVLRDGVGIYQRYKDGEREPMETPGQYRAIRESKKEAASA